MTEIAIAYDVPALDDALELDRRLGEGPEIAKIGLELFTAAGPAAVRALVDRGRRVFLDLKLHDIPNTVRGAARSAARLGAELLTVHALGGRTMIAAAVEGAREGGGTRIVAVTVLTSLDASNLPPGFERPFFPQITAARMLTIAESAGAFGIVCAATDIPDLRVLVRHPFYAVTPGIRPHGVPTHDQARVATIAEAVRMGSSLLVLGRALTGASDPRAALDLARAERDQAVAAIAG
ncbi:MAG TPA: orotidine-5'-phosphate decarboxylase [Candidatus Limnocylindria bacterium]|nr:orotidine-5'-phosphate decarboxylase [Candidatus Limnocylindria bacterium]